MKVKYPKILILVRHGESEKDKNNPQRKLTSKGRVQIEKDSEAIRPMLDNASAEIISTTAVRTSESAKIISESLRISFNNSFDNLRIENVNQLDVGNDKSIRIYLETYKKGMLPKNIPSPPVIVRRFEDAISQTKSDILIVIGHSGAMEVFAWYQKAYNLQVPLTKEVGYADFVVLTRKE